MISPLPSTPGPIAGNLQSSSLNLVTCRLSVVLDAKREQATHAPQALELLNGKTSNELAGRFAERLLAERKTAPERVELAFRLATGRPPTRTENTLAMNFLAGNPAPAKVKEFALAVFNLNSFIYVE